MSSAKGKEIRKNNNKRHKQEGTYREWQRNNKDKVKQYRNEHAHKQHDITDEEWEVCKEYFDYSCAYCGISETDAQKKYGQRLHKEHANNNGENTIVNCVPACKSCNSSKRTGNYSDWYTNEKTFFELEKLSKINEWLNRGCFKF